MATRVRGYQASGGVQGGGADPRGVAADHQYTEGLVEDSVEEALRHYCLTDEQAVAVRSLIASDPESGLAHAYFAGMASKGAQQAYVRSMRKEIHIPHVMSDEEQRTLVRYAEDFKVVFKGVKNHDHPLYAAQRMIDQCVVESRVPQGVPYADLGGSAIHHAKGGNRDVHICNPVVDRKDQARRVLVNLTLRRLTQEREARQGVREYAQAVLDRDKVVACGLRAQDCEHKTRYAIAVHVYDVPMHDWPAIMETRGIQVVEGCMLFSQALYGVTSGNFPAAGIRYQIDVAKDEYRMGFDNSPSWWYPHSYREHVRYGADQILSGKTGLYSYKVVERRENTIFFRILRVGGTARPNERQVYRMPGVPMVKVSGLSVEPEERSAGAVHSWCWPQPLWEEMVAHAEAIYDRGAYSPEKMFNFYRSVAPRQVINSVLVAGGHTADLQERAALVVYASVAGFLRVIKTRNSFKVLADQEQAFRNQISASGVERFMTSLASLAGGPVRYVCTPLRMVAEWFRRKGREDRGGVLDVFSVAPEVEFVTLPASVVLGVDWDPKQVVGEVPVPDVVKDSLAEVDVDHITAAMNSPVLAKIVLDLVGVTLEPDVRAKLAQVVERAKKKEQPGAVFGSAEVSVRTPGFAETVRSTSQSGQATVEDDQRVAEIRCAIREAIVECELEQGKVQASCGEIWLKLITSGKPDKVALMEGRERMFSPDMWWLQNGVVGPSVLGRAAVDFDLSALYLPVPSDTGGFLHPVTTELYEGASEGGQVSREYFLVAGGYTGWALGNDSLKVYNGPEIVAAMGRALSLDVADFRVSLMWGPPGCGKTTQIVRALQPGEVVLCPARKSVRETRERVLSARPGLVFPVKKRIRTLDSYLVNVGRSEATAALRAEVLRADEVFMARAGKWYAACLLLGVKEAYVYGDDRQIPHVPRALCPKQYLHVECDVREDSWVTYRCPADAVAAWGHLYDWRVRSASTVSRSISRAEDYRQLVVPTGCVMMGMYQQDKKTLATMYAGVKDKVRIMTVHESQGNTYGHVWLHRFDVRKRSKEDRTALYDKVPYVLVAMSRHTETFVYICPRSAQDEVTRMVKQAESVRRQHAAAEVDTAGSSKEMI